MVGVAKGTSYNYGCLLAYSRSLINIIFRHTSPCHIPIQMFDINQYPLEFNNGKGGVRVIQLDSNLIWKFTPCAVCLLKPSDNVM